MIRDNKKYKKIRTNLCKKHNISTVHFTRYLFYNLLNVKYENYEERIKITRDLFVNENGYNNFIRQFKGNDSFVYNKDINEIYLGINFSIDIYKIVIDELEEIKQSENDEYDCEEQETNEDIQINNIFTLQNFINHVEDKINNKLIVLNEKQKQLLEKYKIINNNSNDPTKYYVPTKNINFENIYVLINKENDNEKILSNFLIDETKILQKDDSILLTQKYYGELIKLKIIIKKKITNYPERLVSKYMFVCSRCGSSFDVWPYELNGQIKHACPGWFNNNGIQRYTSIEKKSGIPKHFQQLSLYEFELIHNKQNNEKIPTTYVLYSKNPNLNYGSYLVDVLIQEIPLNPCKSFTNTQNVIYCLNYEKIKPKINKELIINKLGTKISEELNIPYVKLLDILQSIRDVYKEYLNEEIDNQGMWLQLTTLIAGLGRTLFNFRKIGVSVVSNKSLSKTYSATRIGIIIDPMYYYLQSTSSMSSVGFSGGINNGKKVNNKVISVFEAGVVASAGLSVFDEASRFFTEDSFQESLKALPEPIMDIKKVGGEPTRQTYVPVLLSNFTRHSNEYKKAVKETYIKLVKFEQSKTGKIINEQEINALMSEINYYLPLHHYQKIYKDNETLIKAFRIVRTEYANSDKDWKTGAALPAINRLFFDIVVSNKEKLLSDGYEIKNKYTKLGQPDPEIIPIVEFQKEIKLKFGRNINIDEEMYNNKEIQLQIISLRNSICEWLNGKDNKGNCVFKWLTRGANAIDSKENNVLYNICIIIQLIEDYKSCELCNNVKKFLEILLTKTKRGLTVDEYDFKDNETKYYEVNSKIDSDITNLLEAEQYEHDEQIRKQAVKSYENKKNKDKITVNETDDADIDVSISEEEAKDEFDSIIGDIV